MVTNKKKRKDVRRISPVKLSSTKKPKKTKLAAVSQAVAVTQQSQTPPASPTGNDPPIATTTPPVASVDVVQASRFQEWFDEKLQSTTDQEFKRVLTFVKTMRVYRLFRASVRCGDAVAVEWLYANFIPVWFATSKKHCYQNALYQIDDLYQRIPFDLLQHIRVNRMRQLYTGKNQRGRVMANWAIDAVIELVQAKYKQMNFPNTPEGWVRHTPHMGLVAACSALSSNEYSRRFDIESFNAMFEKGEADGDSSDKSQSKKASTPMSNVAEKILISEILHLADVCVEQPGRALGPNTLWNVLKSVTTTLAETNDASDANRLFRSRQGIA